MFVVIADGKVVFSTDVDDVAWEVSQEQKDDFGTIYVEEVYQNQFDSEGKYTTTSGDVITLQEILSAEKYYRDEDMCPKPETKSIKKKKTKKASRKYWEEKVDSLYSNAAKRILYKLDIPFEKDADELELKNMLEAKLKTMLKQDDEFSDSIFAELDACSELSMNIESLTRFVSDEEAQNILVGKIKAIDDSVVSEGDEFELADSLFESIANKADASDKSMQEVFLTIKD